MSLLPTKEFPKRYNMENMLEGFSQYEKNSPVLSLLDSKFF